VRREAANVLREKTRTGGEPLCCRISGRHQPEETGRLRPYTGLYSLSETGTGRAPAGTTQRFPAALAHLTSVFPGCVSNCEDPVERLLNPVLNCKDPFVSLLKPHPSVCVCVCVFSVRA
jgi:hypothetical protein